MHLSLLLAATLAVSPSAIVPTLAAPLTPATQTIPSSWKTYKNPIGLSFRYPDSWTMTDINGFLLLVPPGATAAPGSVPSEIYAVLALPATNFTRVDDPRLFQMADGLVAQSFPYMRRNGDGEAVKVAGLNGLVVTYDGTNPTTSKPSRIRSYAVIYKGLLLQIQAWGERDKISARDDVLRQIFSSLKTGTSEYDSQMVGVWVGGEASSDRTTRGEDGGTRSAISSQASSAFRLMPDGTLYALTVSRSSVTVRSSSGTPESQRVDATLDSGNQQQWKKGKWYAGGGKVVVLMDDGTGMSADYKVMGNTLTLRFAGGAAIQFTKR